VISAKEVTKIYEGKVSTVALSKVSFAVSTGEFVAIMGRSGSGKSTLLHQLSLLDRPTSGSISIDDVDVLRMSDGQKTAFRLKNLGYVFQEYALVGELTALENVYLPAFALGMKDGDYRARSTELLETVGLGHRLRHYPHEMSGGEQQRVAIARSLVNSPKVLFADEPTANLDSVSARVVLELFQRLNREMAQTIMMVTHEIEDRRFVDRVLWLRDGVLDENPAELREYRSVGQSGGRRTHNAGEAAFGR
jgi:putative ABC transport system ATP-binding protein